MTRAQAILAGALNLRDRTPLPTYVTARASEVDYLLRESHLPAEHPVVQAHVAAVVADWWTLEAAAAMERGAREILAALGLDAPPRPPASRRGTHPRAVWTALSMAWTGRHDAEALPNAMLARSDEIETLLRTERLSLEHPAVRARAARIATECRAQEVATLARAAAGAIRSWQDKPVWRRVLDVLRPCSGMDRSQAAPAGRRPAVNACDAP